MSRWFRMYDELLDDYSVQKMPPDEFRRAFFDIAEGRINPLSRFVKITTGRPPPKEWSELRARAFRRDDYTCQYCGVRGVQLQCDHIIPVSRGGSNDLSNLATACRKCNLSKHDKTPEEWLS